MKENNRGKNRLNNNEKKDNKFDKKPDSNLPFFAYGIFKPGQIAYSKIRGLDFSLKEASINYLMKQRDGVPILLQKGNERYNTKGCLYDFSDGEKAYKIICQTMSPALYEWSTIDVEGEKANVLFGLKPDSGSDSIEDACARECFDGRNDPIFKEGIQLIRKNLDEEDFDWEEGFFKLQMNYMLLWSAIDRYCKLKYNMGSEHENRLELAKENNFIDALRKIDDTREYRPIFSTDDLIRRSFDVSNPKYCINYYYTLRCNIVHRGKTSIRDLRLLKKATADLLEIFEYILDETFGEK